MENSGENKRVVDAKDIYRQYRLTHADLDTCLKRLRDKVLEELEEFSNKLLGSLNHLNYFRYMRAYPEDDIQFVLQEKINANTSENRVEEKQDIMNKMSNFQTIKTDYSGVSDNCIYEIEEYLNENTGVLNFKNICPSAVSFLNQNEEGIKKLEPYWDKSPAAMDLSGIFKEASDQFPKQEMKKLGIIFSDANKKVTGAKLIFRASSHNFQSASFKDHCSGIAPTLMLAKSQKGLIFGGFTPCKWLKTKEKQFVSDPQAGSFLFSLTHTQLFPIKKTQKDYAISAYGGWGPIFGSPYGPDLSISDKCHINDHSCSSLGSHYQIPANIKQYSNEAFCLLAGAKKFKIVQYEIFELELDQE